MATSAPDTAGNELYSRKFKTAVQQKISNFVAAALLVHQKNNEMQDKMDKIDQAYARYKEALTRNQAAGQDIRALGEEGCGNIFDQDNVTPPIVVSQVDTYVAYLAEVFLSGYPMFPVASNPANKIWAEQLETLLDDHALLGAYPRHLLMFIKDSVKYNYSAIEVDWDQLDQFTIAGDFLSGTGKRLDRKAKSFNKLKRLNPRNTFRDMTCSPGEISEIGDYAGYIERISRMRAKRELNKLTAQGRVYNAEKAMDGGNVSWLENYYREDPVISQYTPSASTKNMGPDWDSWFDGIPRNGQKPRNYGQQIYRVVMYARILPAEFGMPVPQPNTPQIWKFIHHNDVLVAAYRVISAYDYLPILFGHPLEDGLGYQTQSVAEGEIPFQDAANTLFNIRFASARRAVSDRALYDAEHLTAADVNSRAAAPKIPVRISALSKKTLSDVYHQIPFDPRGVDNVLQDAQALVGFSKELHGGNAPRTGQFQKGNKSVQEWNDTMAGSDNRYRLPAMMLEYQVFSPMKSIMVLNIYQYGDNMVLISQRNGQEYNIDIEKLRKQVLAFRVADGYTPKAKLASADMLTMGFNLIQQSPMLQQAYGNRLASIFAHMMSLGGVRGFEQYDPTYQPAAQPPGLGNQTLQAPVLPGPAGAPTLPQQTPALPPGNTGATQVP